MSMSALITHTQECALCMTEENDPTRLLRPCRDRTHVYCEDCWRDWEEAHSEDILPCPTCRQMCFKEPFRRCRAFCIVRSAYSEEYEEDGVVSVELIHRRYDTIYEAFEGFCDCMRRWHYTYDTISWMDRHKIFFYLPGLNIQYHLSERLLRRLYFYGVCGGDLSDLYHPQEEDPDDEVTVHSIHSSELDEMNDAYEEDEAWLSHQHDLISDEIDMIWRD